MKAEKGNKEYNISSEETARYQAMGYDIKDESGNIIAYGKGKTVPYGTYKQLEKELAELKKSMEDTGGQEVSDKQKESAEDITQAESAEDTKKSAKKKGQ